MWRLLFLLAAGLLAGRPAQAQLGTIRAGTLAVGGLVRDYLVYVPPSYQPGRPAPVLLNLHGYTSNNQDQLYYGDFRAIADTAGLLLVLPNGSFDGYGNRYWNTFAAPGSGGPDDVAFIDALLTHLATAYTTDANRLYATGFSNGGFMSYELACHLGGRLAAVASVAGSLVPARLGSCTPAHPTPVLEIHGTADGTVPYAGNAQFLPVQSVLGYWVQANGCNALPTVLPVPDLDPTDNCTATRLVWGGGRNGSTVAHYRVQDGGHTWPGSAYTIGTTNRDFSASREIWRFLCGYRLGGLALAAAPASAPATGLSLYPNPAAGAAEVLLSGPATLRPEQVSAFDALGRAVPVAATSLRSGTLVLALSDWPAGLYVLRVAGQPGVLKLLR